MTAVHVTQNDRRLRPWAAACAASGVLGVLAGVLTLAVPARVAADVWSYPFSFAVGLALGVVLAGIHVLTALGFVALRRITGDRAGRAAHGALGLAVAGLVLLAVAELASGLIGRQVEDSTAAGIVDALFGVASLVLVVGSVWAGVLLLRRRVGPPRAAWAVLASGVVLLLLVLPANVAGDLGLRTGALMLWSLCFVALGAALASAAPAAAVDAVDG